MTCRSMHARVRERWRSPGRESREKKTMRAHDVCDAILKVEDKNERLPRVDQAAE